ncbi:iron complex outermembrane receptor protein [Povalibacter uvarum]|uniref:Iron complex outermembrane receptor protein n=1 Tax=Povalibacter uvarum TaxID=732238 RepID=A0A841HV63_9GAMM|nr:TonB-dependent receptor [Povalibacter uvarum]MBB6095838.1 iron complex outermembrane receptor protein [Povalibacter uvarum]
MPTTAVSLKTVLMAVSVAASIPTAGAQTQVDAPGSDVLESIIVTAGKHRERLQDLPASIWVATEENLSRSEVRDFDDLVRIAPSLTITKTTQPANNSINIRGVGTYAFSIATKPSVSVIVDDVLQSFQAQAFQALADVSQVEILRGPQSTLFGTSATAGVVNITTNSPGPVFEAGGKAMATDDGESRLSGFLSGPVTDELSARLFVGAVSDRGNLYNTFTQNWVNGHRDVFARAKLLWEPSEPWTVALSAYWSDTEASCCTWASQSVSPGVTFGRFQGYRAPQADVLNGITPGSSNRLISADVDPRGDAVDYGGSVKVERRIGELSLLSITALNRYQLEDRQDTDGTAFNWGPGGAGISGAIPGGSANGGWFQVDSITEELRLVSPQEDRFRFLAALYFNQTDSERSFVRGSNTLTQYGTLTTVPATGSAYSTYLANARATNYALFGTASFDVTSRFGIVAGMRVNHEELSYSLIDRFNQVTFGVPDCSTSTTSGLAVSTCDDFDSFSGKVAITYEITPAMMLFAGYDRGYKGAAYDLTSTYTMRSPVTATGPYQGFPIGDAVAAQQPVAPETVDGYQFGVKGQLNPRLYWSLTLFDQVFHDFQAQSRDELTQQNILNSIEQATTRGVEAEVTASLGERLSLTASGSYNEATIDEFPGAPCFSSQTPGLGCVAGKQDLSGRPLPNAPRWKFSLDGQFEQPLINGYSAFAAASWHWQSSVMHSLLQDPMSVQDSYGLLNLAVGIESNRWRLKAFCVNVLDQNYSLTRGRDGAWNINPYGAAAAPTSDATRWTPGSDSARYLGLELSVRY